MRDKSLLDLHLAPRSILHFRFLEDTVTLDRKLSCGGCDALIIYGLSTTTAITGPPPLYPEILSRAIELPLPVSPEAPSSRPLQASSQGTSGSKSTVSADPPDKSKKIAKLLRLGRFFIRSTCWRSSQCLCPRSIKARDRTRHCCTLTQRVHLSDWVEMLIGLTRYSYKWLYAWSICHYTRRQPNIDKSDAMAVQTTTMQRFCRRDID